MTLPALTAGILKLFARLGLLSFVPVLQIRQLIANATNQIHSNTLTQASVRNDEMHQLLVDVSVIHQHDAGTGIQRVVRSVLSHLQTTSIKGYSVHRVMAQTKRKYQHVAEARNENASEIRVQKGDIFLGLDLAAHLLPKHVGQLLEWKLAGVRLHFVVYDILPLTHPAHFKAKRVRHFRRWARLITSLADSLLCISHVVQTDLQAWLKQNFRLTPAQLPTQVIPLGGDFAKSTAPTQTSTLVQQTLSQLQGQHWALMVGTLEPRKCHAQVLDAFEQLWLQNQPVCLVLVGRAGWHTEALQQRIAQHHQLNRKLYWFADANDAELELFYQQTTGVLAASLAEGYGLPLREAMAHGKPLLARDIPVFREVAGDYAQYFSNDKALPFSDTIEAWLTVPHRNAPASAASWATATKMIIQTLDIAPAYFAAPAKDELA